MLLFAPTSAAFVVIDTIVFIAIIAGSFFMSERNFRQKAEAIAAKTKKLL